MVGVFAKVLAAPVPLLAGFVYFAGPSARQTPSPFSEDAMTDIGSQGPEWLIGAVAGIWLVVWLLDKLGKLPSGGPDRRRGPKFEETDRRAILDIASGVTQLGQDFKTESARWNDLHNLLTFRSGEDGIERWLKHHQTTNESKAILERLVAMTEEVRALRNEEHRKTGVLVSTLETIQRQLAAQNRTIESIRDDLEERRGSA